MKYLALLFLVSIISSCGDEISACIDEMKKDFIELNRDRGSTGISTFELNGETYHIFDNGIAFDATALVVNSKCEEVCSYGGFRPVDENLCEEFWEGINGAVQIWP